MMATTGARRELRSAPIYGRTSFDGSRSRSSSYLDLSPLPENVGLEPTQTLSSSFESTSGDVGKAPPVPKMFPRQLEMEEKGMRPVSAPEASNATLRSARYLANQWRSRSTQWSASSSMRSFTESSTLSSLPPPPLREHDSSSDSDSATGSLDDSVLSQVSEAQKFIHSWRLRSASMSQDSDDSSREVTTSWRSKETVKMSGNSNTDEFGSSKTNHFPEFFDENDDQVNYSSSSNEELNYSFDPFNDSQRTLKTSGNIETHETNPTRDGSAGFEESQKTQRTSGNTKNYLGPVATPDAPISPSKLLDESPRTIIPTALPRQKALQIKEIKPESNPLMRKVHLNVNKSLSASIQQSQPIRWKAQRPSKRQEKESSLRQQTKKIPELEQKAAPITWAVFDFMFTFSLLTNEEKAPPVGDYIPDDDCTSFKDRLRFRSKLLHDIADKFAVALRKIRSRSNERGKYMMCPPNCTPSINNVRRDTSFVAPEERKDTVRSFVRVLVSVFVPKGDEEAKKAAKSIVRVTFAETIRSGDFNGF